MKETDLFVVQRTTGVDSGTYKVAASDIPANAVVSATAPTDPMDGGLWLDTNSDTLKTWDGSAWVEPPPGGVTQIVAGNNVTISPTDGTGVVTVNAAGGGGGGDVTINYNGASAWGTFDGTDGNLEGGLNVASVTRTNNGRYTVVFSTALPSANYSVVASSSGTTGNNVGNVDVVSQSSTGFDLKVADQSNTTNDAARVNFAVHSQNALPPKSGTGTDAWGTVQSDGTIDASFNVGSVTKTATGKYDVVFTTPMPTANYAIVGSVAEDSGSFLSFYGQTSTGFTARVQTYEGGSTDKDFSFTVNATNATLPLTFSSEQIEAAINNPGASAWGNIAGDGTVENGLNIASVTRTATGNFDVVFTTPMPTADYSVVGSSYGYFDASNQSTTGFSVGTRNPSNVLDNYAFNFTVFATNSVPLKGGTGTDAWGACQGDGTIDASFNVASVVRTSQATYEITFSTPMPTDNYSVTFGGEMVQIRLKSKTTSGFTMDTYDGATSLYEGLFSFQVNATNAVLPQSFTEAQAQQFLAFVASGGLPPIAILQDIQTTSEASTAGWQDRIFNTVDDVSNLVSLDANKSDFTLQPGTYLIEWFGTGLQTGYMKSRLTNVTTGDTVGLGSSTYSNGTGDYASVMTCGTTRVQIASASTFKIEQHSYQSSGYGFGIGATQGGEDDLFAQVTITGTPS